MRIASLLIALSLCVPALAGEPLVVKSSDGKFIPAAAAEWAKAGDTIRFVLKSGIKAADAAADLSARIAPITVRATDEFTLIFEGKDLTEAALLEKLSGLPLGEKDKGKADAVAALSALGNEGPGLSDLSSAGSIRVSRAIDLPPEPTKKDDLQNIFAKVIHVCECGAVPSVVVKILRVPRKGPNAKAFWVGQTVSVRGYFKQKEGSAEPDDSDARTKINMGSRELKAGDKVWGRPIQKDGEEWILETVQKL